MAWHDKRFVLCSLPIKRPPRGSLSYIRRNGNVTLSPGDPDTQLGGMPAIGNHHRRDVGPLLFLAAVKDPIGAIVVNLDVPVRP